MAATSATMSLGVTRLASCLARGVAVYAADATGQNETLDRRLGLAPAYVKSRA